MDIHIKGVQSLADLIDALDALAYAFHNQPRLLGRDDFTLVKAEESDTEHLTKPFPDRFRNDGEPDGYSVVAWPRPIELGPIPCPEAYDKYVPCPGRGTHLRLTECWACWSDVHRGAVVETDVLNEDAWESGLRTLVP